MKRRNRDAGPVVTPSSHAAGVPPWIDQWGREVWDNPWGQCRPNPRLTASTQPALRSATGLPVVPRPVAAGTALPLDAPTHDVTDDVPISADDERIRATLQYAKGYAKACKALGIEIPDEMRERLKNHTAQRRNRVHKRVRRTAAASIAVGAGFVGINAAAAYFTTGGHGSGAATTGSLSVTAVAGTPQTPLLPGGSGPVRLSVTNNSDTAVTVTQVTGASAPSSVSGGLAGTPACSVGNAGVTFGGTFTPNTAIPADNAGSPVIIDLPGAAQMASSSDNHCQGATFNFDLTLQVKSQ